MFGSNISHTGQGQGVFTRLTLPQCYDQPPAWYVTTFLEIGILLPEQLRLLGVEFFFG